MNLESILIRLAVAKKKIDQGYSYISIAVDNAMLAEKMYDFLRGRMRDDNGQLIDPMQVLGWPEEYRNRVFIISCGQRGVYSGTEVKEELMAA